MRVVRTHRHHLGHGSQRSQPSSPSVYNRGKNKWHDGGGGGDDDGNRRGFARAGSGTNDDIEMAEQLLSARY